MCAARRALYADQAGIAARLVAVLHEFPPAMDAHANRRVTRMVDAEIRRGLAKHPPHHLRADTFGRGRRMRGVVAVDGTIGAGKSTAIAAVACKGRSRVVSFPEPIGEWAGLLSLVYAGKAGAALAFQGLVLLYFHNLGHLIRSRRRPDGCVHLVERTMQSADVFVKNMQNTPGFSAKDGRIYAEWCRRADRWVPFSACYLSLQSGVALQRTVERGRTCEGGLSSAFLGQLTHLYDSHYTQLAAEQAEWESRSPQDRQWLPPVMGVVRISAGASSRDEIANQVWTVCETSSYATPPAELPPVDAEEKHQANEANEANEANRVMRLQDKVNEADEVPTFSLPSPFPFAALRRPMSSKDADDRRRANLLDAAEDRRRRNMLIAAGVVAGNYDVALPHYNEAIEMAEGPSEKGTLYTKYEDPDFSEAAGEPVTELDGVRTQAKALQAKIDAATKNGSAKADVAALETDGTDDELCRYFYECNVGFGFSRVMSISTRSLMRPSSITWQDEALEGSLPSSASGSPAPPEFDSHEEIVVMHTVVAFAEDTEVGPRVGGGLTRTSRTTEGKALLGKRRFAPSPTEWRALQKILDTSTQQAPRTIVC